MTKEGFYQAIAHRGDELSLNFDGFLNRPHWQWSFEFEILVRDNVPPAYILGLWDTFSKEWIPWNQPKCAETNLRLQFYLDLLRSS